MAYAVFLTIVSTTLMLSAQAQAKAAGAAADANSQRSPSYSRNPKQPPMPEFGVAVEPYESSPPLPRDSRLLQPRTGAQSYSSKLGSSNGSNSRPQANANASGVGSSTLPSGPSTADRLRVPIEQIKSLTSDIASNTPSVNWTGPGFLEGAANSAVLAKVISTIYATAGKAGWKSRDTFQIFPIENLLDIYPALASRENFHAPGLRVAVLALKQFGRKQRAILLTSTFQSVNPDEELHDLFKQGVVAPMIDNATQDYEAYAREIVKRMNSGSKRESEYVPVVAAASKWVVGCESTLAGRFCVNALVFDAYDTDPGVFYDALLGTQETNSLIVEIRKQNLLWPIEQSFITRGFKACGCGDQHYGLDLAANIGTPVHAVSSGTVRNAGNFPGWGRAVVIEHTLPAGAKYISLYAHLSRFKKGLKIGDSVTAGNVIALSGSTGRSHGPHLHLEIRALEDGKEPLRIPQNRAERPIDPMRVLNVFNMLFEPVNVVTMR